MLAELITVTSSPKSIYHLLKVARDVGNDVIPHKCTGIKLRYKTTETESITLTDKDSAVGAEVLCAAIESLVSVSFKCFDLKLVHLNSESGSVGVDIIVEQDRV